MSTFLRQGAAIAACFCPIVAVGGGVPASSGVDEIIVTTSIESLQGTPVSATQGVVTGKQLEGRPLQRTGEMLEVVPGLIVTQHSGDGKANQYFLRGFNLDHGTDLATSVDGVPVNMPTHAHGQGYTDVNFVIPELVQSIAYRKGTYYADTGNFSAAGAVDLSYRNKLDAPLLTLEAGEYNYRRVLGAGGLAAAGGDLLLAMDYTSSDGPWDLDQDLDRVNALARYTRESGDHHFGITMQAYDADWNSTDQIPLRAVEPENEGNYQINRFGNYDPSDGGESHRYSLSAVGSGMVNGGEYALQAYAVDYRMQLFSNFTYATDPGDGDQFEQFDERHLYGSKAEWKLPLGWRIAPGAIMLGTDLRYDDIDTVGLYQTAARERIETTREDAVDQLGVGAYIALDTRWNDWLRTNLGLRADRFEFDVDSNLAANSGSRSDGIVSPKFSIVFGPWRETEFFGNLGKGFHSNDARGTTITVDPTDPTTTVSQVDPLVDALGAECGIRTAILPRTQFSVALWQLRLDSELLFVGDAGITEPNRKSKREGVEFSIIHTPFDWLILDLDLAWTHARFDEPDTSDPSIGERIPGAVENVAALGVAVNHPSGWSAGLRFRHFGEAPLIEDNSVRSHSTTLVNLESGYHFTDNLRATISLLNAFDSDDNDITYYYESRLPGEIEPVSDIHFHPVEPRTMRVSLTTMF